MPNHDNIKTTNYIQAAMLLANGCILADYIVNQSQFVEFNLIVPHDKAAKKAAIISDVYGPAVAKHVRELRDIIRNSTNPGGHRDEQA